jgi:enoyl-CoA hydratase/carnithine racemase
MVKVFTSINEVEDELSKYVDLEIRNGVAILKMTRDEALNALNTELINQLDNYVIEIQKDSNIRAVLITGGNNFAAGADIKEMIDCNEEEAAKFNFSPTFQKIYELEIPTIAAIEGYALGGGLELAITCDLRIASSKAKMGFPETGLGIMPGAGGTVITPRLLNISKTMELILLGKIINADEAYQIGLINKVVDPGRTFEEAFLWAEKLSKGAPIALKTAKKSIRNNSEQKNYRQGLEFESNLWAGLFNTKDQKEGMTAFTEKRKPIYKGE